MDTFKYDKNFVFFKLDRPFPLPVNVSEVPEQAMRSNVVSSFLAAAQQCNKLKMGATTKLVTRYQNMVVSEHARIVFVFFIDFFHHLVIK